MQVLWHAGLLGEAPDDAPTGGVVAGFAYVLENDALVVALASGELLQLLTESQEIEEVGSIDGGIAALEVSPDGELLAIISGSGNLLLMNNEWQLLAEVPLLNDEELHALEAASPPRPLDTLFHDATITWRGDAKFFATSVASPADPSTRTIKTWERSGCELNSTAEAAPYLLPAMAWQPNCRHLYVCQQQPAGDGADSPSSSPSSSKRVKLYETNGLQHGHFDVCGAGSIAAICWSGDSELLAVLMRPDEGDEERKWKLQVGAGGLRGRRWARCWRGAQPAQDGCAVPC